MLTGVLDSAVAFAVELRRLDLRYDKMDETASTAQTRQSKIKAWSILLVSLGLVVLFAFVIGPWFQKQVPIVDEMFTLIEAHDINSNAYFYTDIEASYDGANYLKNAIRLSDEKEARLNIPFIAGLICCILILWVGFKYLPLD